MNFIHFGLRMEIERLYLEWCEEEGIANKPNSMVVFLMEKGWLNQEQIIKDLNKPKDESQGEILIPPHHIGFVPQIKQMERRK